MNSSHYQIEIANEQALLDVDEELLARAVRTVFAGENVGEGEVSVAIVDGEAMHALNRRYLEHDYPTDVLSFLLDESETSAGHRIEGQIIASADYALEHAAEYGWSAAEELLLYIVHGALHLVGYDDCEDDDREQMRRAEREYLARLGVSVPLHELPGG